jgi:hypothetical protein
VISAQFEWADRLISRLRLGCICLVLATCLLPACGRVRPPPPRVVAEVFNLLPKTEAEGATVFRQANRADVLEVIRAGNRLGSLGHSAGSSLEEALGRDSGVLILVGHNEGGVIVTPDGRRLPLVETARRCADAGKLCVFLSCNSSSVGQNGAIGIDYGIEARRAATLAQQMLLSTERGSTDQLSLDLQRIANDQGYRFVRYELPLGTAAGTSTGLFVVAMDQATQG